MDIHHLLRMANQIGTFFEAMPERDQALQEIAQHLRKFWEPRMRRELLAHLDASGGAGLLPSVKDALAAHRALVEPPAATTDR